MNYFKNLHLITSFVINFPTNSGTVIPGKVAAVFVIAIKMPKLSDEKLKCQIIIDQLTSLTSIIVR